MFDFLNNLDRNSFWIGVIVGSLFWWLLGIFRPFLRRGWEQVKAVIGQAREGLSAGVEIRHANDILRRVQGMHLAAPLFSLDEIRIPPRVLAPPPKVRPGEEPPLVDVVSQTIPYLPEWPELASIYGARRLGLAEALSGGTNLVLLGKTGFGKTFALADLASMIARKEEEAGPLADFVPIFLHVFDFPPDLTQGKAPIDVLIEAAGRYTSALAARQLPGLIENAFSNGRGLLLLDGLDELVPADIDRITTFLADLMQEFPRLRAVVAASPTYYGGLRRLGFYPMAVAAWDDRQRIQFIQRWTELWTRSVNPDIWPEETRLLEDGQEQDGQRSPVDATMLEGWLLADRSTLSPLDLTLKVWSVYAGDVLGRSLPDALEAYLRRMTAVQSDNRPALEQLAMRMIAGQTAVIGRSEVDATVTWQTSGPTQPDEDEGESPNAGETPSQINVRRSLSRLSSAGLLLEWPDNRVAFVHPMVLGYLAGTGFASQGNQEVLGGQPPWIGNQLSLQFLAACGQGGPWATKLLETSADPLHEDLFTVAQWISSAPKKEGWRALILRRLAKLTQSEVYSVALRGRALAALAATLDEDVSVLFRHLLNDENPIVRQLGALGAGFMKDQEAIEELAVKLYDPSPNVHRATCLALVQIGSQVALEHVASALLHGDEDLRRAAAEAFANHPEEGHPILKDGTKLDDLLVRRAVVFGLQRVAEDWAVEILETMQVEDGQWVVRNAATQALEELEHPDPYIPQPLKPLHETPWMVAFAGERGMGVTEGKPAREMLGMALKEGKVEERVAALSFVHLTPDTGMILDIYNMLYGSEIELREAAFNALWHLKAEGVDLPSPTQFGLGV